MSSQNDRRVALLKGIIDVILSPFYSFLSLFVRSLVRRAIISAKLLLSKKIFFFIFFISFFFLLNFLGNHLPFEFLGSHSLFLSFSPTGSEE